METEHTEGVVEKAVAFVKDMFGTPLGDRTPDEVAKPEYADTAPELTSDDAMRLDPHAYTFNKIVERSRQITDAEHADSAVDEHEQAARQLESEGSAQSALDEIQDISRGMREETDSDGKDLPSDREMKEEIERARAAHSKEKSRQAGEQADRW